MHSPQCLDEVIPHLFDSTHANRTGLNVQPFYDLEVPLNLEYMTAIKKLKVNYAFKCAGWGELKFTTTSTLYIC